MRLFEAIEEANQEGRLGLILYTVPNYPNPAEFRSILAELSRRRAVSVVEMTFAVNDSFSDHANETIRNAHRQAFTYEEDYRKVLAAYRYDKASLCVLYQKTATDHSFGRVVQEMSGQIDGVLLEWNEDEHQSYFDHCGRAGVELVQCVGPWMSSAQLEHILGFCQPKALVYLMSAPMTGARLFPQQELERLIALSKQIRPDIKMAAGFGIRTADDVRRLSRVNGWDGVIIGTAFLERMGAGLEAVSTYLDEIEGALAHEPARASL
ncbi:MAG TPA: tryptophan synthase subunit alpha [Archangium sp.]|nr:tryptophan synthase subunit alpha [Archangium sp.]